MTGRRRFRWNGRQWLFVEFMRTAPAWHWEEFGGRPHFNGHARRPLSDLDPSTRAACHELVAAALAVYAEVHPNARGGA